VNRGSSPWCPKGLSDREEKVSRGGETSDFLDLDFRVKLKLTERSLSSGQSLFFVFP